MNVLGRWRLQGSALGFAQLLSGNVAVSVSQGLQFLLLARFLGPDDFGQVAAASGILTVLVPFSGMGSANVMVMRCSRDRTLIQVYYGNSLATVLLSGLLLLLLSLGFVIGFLPNKVPLVVMGALGAAELIGHKVVDISWHAFLSRDQPHYVSRLVFVRSACRLVAAALFVTLTTQPLATQWVWWALASDFGVALAVLYVTASRIGRPRLDFRLALSELKTGAFFAVSISAKGFYADADKILLARFATPAVVGLYTAAFRIVQLSLVLIRALSAALQTRLFRAGERGIAGSMSLVTRVLGPAVPVALFLAVGYYVTAPLLPYVAGDAYADSVDILRVLCLLPLFQVSQSLLGDALNSSGHHRIAAGFQALCAVLVCGLGVWWIPRWGWLGAAASSYVAQASLSLLLLAAITRLRKTAPRPAAPASSPEPVAGDGQAGP